MKLTKKSLAELARRLGAVDITRDSVTAERVGRMTKLTIAYSVGQYGMSGIIVRDMDSGNFYAVLNRATTLFAVV